MDVAVAEILGDAHEPEPSAAHGHFKPSVRVKFAYAFGQMIDEKGYLAIPQFLIDPTSAAGEVCRRSVVH